LIQFSFAAVRPYKPHSGVFILLHKLSGYSASGRVCGVITKGAGASRSFRLYLGLRTDGQHAAGALATYLHNASRRILQSCKGSAAPLALPTDTGAFSRLLACYTILSFSFFKRLSKALFQRVFAARCCRLQERLRFLSRRSKLHIWSIFNVCTDING
jgi:hypothetical protein